MKAYQYEISLYSYYMDDYIKSYEKTETESANNE